MNFDLEDFQLLLEIASVAVTGGAFIIGARSVRVARAMYRTAAALDTSVVLIDLEQGEYADALFGSAFLVVDLRGLGSLADGAEGAEAGVKRALAPTEFAARVSNGTVDLADAVDDLRAVGLFEAADELALRPAGVVGSRAGDTAFVVVSGRQGSVNALLAGGGVATRPAAEKLVDDYVAAIRGGLADPGEFDRLRGLFEADLRVAKAYARWGDDIFDAGGSVIDDLVEAVCSANSFSGDTLVAMADGTMVPIADVQVGDHVLAYDFDTGTTVARDVTATLPHEDWLLEAHLSDGSVMEVTEDHRFWSVTDTAWVELQDLDTDDVLLTPDGATVTVDWLDWAAGAEVPAWDLTVAEEHNFFVAADNTAEPLLVHNAGETMFCGVEVGTIAGQLVDLNRRLSAVGVTDDVAAALRRLSSDLGVDGPAGVDRILNVILDVERRGDTVLAETMARNLAADQRATEGIVRRELAFSATDSANAGKYSELVLGDDAYSKIWGEGAEFAARRNRVHRRIEDPEYWGRDSVKERETASELRLRGRSVVQNPLAPLAELGLRPKPGDAILDGIDTDFKQLAQDGSSPISVGRNVRSFADDPQGTAVVIDATKRPDFEVANTQDNITDALGLIDADGAASFTSSDFSRIDVLLSDGSTVSWNPTDGFGSLE